jgi:hypothetical protein
MIDAIMQVTSTVPGIWAPCNGGVTASLVPEMGTWDDLERHWGQTRPGQAHCEMAYWSLRAVARGRGMMSGIW